MKTKCKITFWLCCALLFCAGSTPSLTSAAFAKPHTPAASSVERKAILNALRPPVQKKAKQKVAFYSVEMKVEKNWAFVSCLVMDKTGKKYALGELDTSALLRKINGRWRVLHWGTAGDIGVACEAHKKYPNSPRAIYGAVLNSCP